MARKRLSWDEEKVKEIIEDSGSPVLVEEPGKDPNTMNQDRHNPPASKYNIGGPSEFGEDQDVRHPWKDEGRSETGHPAPRDIVRSARKLEDKALKCLTIAQRMLPCASEEAIEEQATDLMYLPETAVMATLQRQASLAQRLAEEDKGSEEKAEENVENKVEEKAEVVPAEEEEVKKGGKQTTIPEDSEVPEDKGAMEESPVKEKETEEVKDKEASEEDLLDRIFKASEKKSGVKKLSGIVKQASSEEVSLENIWDCPPDVSKAFN